MFHRALRSGNVVGSQSCRACVDSEHRCKPCASHSREEQLQLCLTEQSILELLTELDTYGPRRGGRDVNAVELQARDSANQRVTLGPAIRLAVFIEGVVDEQLDGVVAIAEPRTEVRDGVRPAFGSIPRAAPYAGPTSDRRLIGSRTLQVGVLRTRFEGVSGDEISLEPRCHRESLAIR